MNKSTEMEIPKLSVAEQEFRLLKRNALVSLLVGIGFLSGPIYTLIEQYTQWADTAIKISYWIGIPSVIYIFYAAISLVVDSWKIEGMRKVASFEDEYSVHVASVANSSALSAVLLIGLISNFVTDEILTLLGSYMFELIFGSVLTAYGATILLLLREDNE